METDGIVLYKSILLSNNERTAQVVRNAMLKLCLEGNPDDYTLAQVLPDKGTDTVLTNFVTKTKICVSRNGTTSERQRVLCSQYGL